MLPFSVYSQLVDTLGTRKVKSGVRLTSILILEFFLLYLFHCYLHHPSTLPISPVLNSSPNPAKSLFTQSSRLSCGLPLLLLPFARLLASFLLTISFIPTSSIRSSICRFSTLFTPAILLTQLFSQPWIFSSCVSVIAMVSILYR